VRLLELQEAHDAEVSQLMDGHKAELAQLRVTQQAEAERLQTEAQDSKSSAESQKRLVQALRQRLAEEEQRADQLQQELEEAQQAFPVVQPPPAVVELPLVSPGQDSSEDVHRFGDIEAPTPPDSRQGGGEDPSALKEHISVLQKRCNSLEQKLDSRPIIFQAEADDSPLPRVGLERRRPAWEPLLRRAGAPVARILRLPDGWEQKVGDRALLPLYDQAEQVLRSFTQRLLKRDAWLWVFYVHLLVLYTISASCLATTSPTDSCVEGLHLEQAPQMPQPIERPFNR